MSSQEDRFKPYTRNSIKNAPQWKFLNTDQQQAVLAISQVLPFRVNAYKLQVIDANGKAHEHLWAIGFPVEGPHFYTHALPRPLKDSRFCQDAATCAEQLVQALGEHRSRYLPAVAPGPSGVDGVPARADVETSGAHYPTLADCD